MIKNIKIDSREQERAFRMKKYFDNNVSCPVSIEQLPVGDYIFNDKVVYELKTWTDFFNSVLNQTVFNEIFNQSMSYPYSFLIIYGDRNDVGDLYWKVSNFHKRFINKYKFDSWVDTTINGAIHRCRTACNVVFCEGEKTACSEMIAQSKKCIVEKDYAGEVRPKKNSNSIVSFLTTINGVSLKKANTIVEELNIKTLKDLCGISKEDLLSIDGFGEKTANKILKVVRGDD